MEDVAALIKKVKASRRKGMNIRRAVSWGIVALFVIYGVLIYRTVTGVDQEELRSSFLAKMRENTPYFSRMLNKTAQEILPVYTEEVRKQMPAFEARANEALAKEWYLFSEHMKENVSEQVNKTGSFLNAERVLLEEAVPELKDDKAVKAAFENLERHFKIHMGNFLNDNFKDHLAAVSDIQMSVEAIRRDTPASAEDKNAIVLLGLGLQVVGSNLEKYHTKN